MKNTTLLFLLIFFVFLGYGQAKDVPFPTVMVSFKPELLKGEWQKYKIEQTVKDSVVLLKSAKTGDSALSQMKEQYLSNNSKDASTNGFYAFVNYVSGDTASILITVGWIVGYRIVIIGDSCKMFGYLWGYNTGEGKLKLNKNDSVDKTELLVPSTSFGLTLAKKPSFVKGEIINGYLAFESQPFYENTRKKQFAINGYFRTLNLQNSKSNMSYPLPSWMIQ